MEAVISGRSGIALLIEGDRFSSISADETDAAVPRRVEDVPYLLGDDRGLVYLEDVDLAEVRQRLNSERNFYAALDLTLILLDPDYSDRVRRLAAEELSEALSSEETKTAVERVLHARPLPTSADLEGAVAVAQEGGYSLIVEFLTRLAVLQSRL